MADFITPLEVRMLPESDDQSWMLISPLKYYSDILQGEIEAPIYFVTNFVSFEFLKGKAQRPSVLHDFLTSCKDVSNELAADIFHEACNSVGVNRALSDIMYAAVISFGSLHHTEEYSLFTKEEV